MSPKKIIFLGICILVLLSVLFGFWRLSSMRPTKVTSLSGSLSIWLIGDTTEGYDTLKEGFKTFAPEYKNIDITFRKFSDTASYQKILLSTLADGNGPDIFMVEAGADTILKEKLEPIPSEYIQIGDFEKRFDDLFLPLLESSGSTDAPMIYIRGVPLGYETLGLFYNKSRLLSVPKTWNEVSALYGDAQGPMIFPTNIGMSPRYTPLATDIVGYFLLHDGIRGFSNIEGSLGSLDEYLSFGTTPLSTPTGSAEDSGSLGGKSLWDSQDALDSEKLTTLDLFMRGQIASIVGYPSTITDIEDAKKRAGADAVEGLILTERIPQMTLSEDPINIARFRYFGLSKVSKNSMLGVKFLDYLLTEDAERRFLQAFPYYIPTQRSFYQSAQNTSLSTVFPRAKLDSFIPRSGEQLVFFDYGNKGTFEKILADNIDRTGKIDKNNIITQISTKIGCEIAAISGQDSAIKCPQE